MHYYFTAVSLIAGVCLGFGILYLFVGLRRKEDKPLSLTFALFAICYAATLFNGIRWYSATTAAEYIAINRFDAIFVTGAFISLIWYVSFYTSFRPRIFMWLLSAALLLPGLVFIFSPATFTGEVSGLIQITLPWGENLNNLDSAGSIWLDFVLLARLVTLLYIIIALIKQFRLGERQPAIILGLGVFPFVTAILYEILGESGVVPFIPFGELGFLGIAIAASLQMANTVIQTEEALEEYRYNLEGLVEERTVKLEAAQGRLLAQAQETAVTAERTRLARDLHDAVTQTIYSASLIAEALPQVWARNPEEGERNLSKLRQLVRGALGEMRTLLFELRPSALEASDMEILIRQLSDALTGRSQIPVELDISVSADPPVDVKITLYRITQEAFSNITKHSSATQARVSLRGDGRQAVLEIWDNGMGFDPQAIPAESMGVHIMTERAEEIGAKMEIASNPGEGTQLNVEWIADQS